MEHQGDIFNLDNMEVPKRYSKEEILDIMINHPKGLDRAIVAIYNLQTSSEQAYKETREANGVGFNGFDGEFLSSLAEQIINGRKLSDKQREIGLEKMKKYANQLTKIANGEI